MSPVLVERRDAIALVTLNRPDALNAVNDALRDALIGALGAANGDAAVRAVVLTGAGDRAFCAGQDLAEVQALELARVDAWLTRQHALYQAVRALDKPCVAALNGVAAGAGFQIALCADLRIGYPEMKIGQPEVRAGLASIVGSYLMTLHVGLTHNVELSLAAELVTGARAYEMGLLTRVVPRADVLGAALAAAAAMAQLPPTAVRLTKQRFRALTQAGFDAALEAAKAAQREAYASGEPQVPTACSASRRRRGSRSRVARATGGSASGAGSRPRRRRTATRCSSSPVGLLNSLLRGWLTYRDFRRSRSARSRRTSSCTPRCRRTRSASCSRSRARSRARSTTRRPAPGRRITCRWSSSRR